MSKGFLSWGDVLSGVAEVFLGARREGCSVTEFLERENDRTSLAFNDALPPELRRSPEQMTHMRRCRSQQPRHICGPSCGMPGAENADDAAVYSKNGNAPAGALG
jgi:hypothetical protein